MRNTAVRFSDLPDGTQAMQGATLVTVAAVDPSHRGPPGTVLTGDQVPVDFRTVREPSNTYRLRGANPRLVTVRTIVTGVRRVVGKFDANGEPIYEVDIQNAMSKAIADRAPKP